MGCVLSVDPKVDEILKDIEKDAASSKTQTINSNTKIENDECDDFEEGYSDDEMFTASDHRSNGDDAVSRDDGRMYGFKSWILDICFKNMGWTFKGEDVTVNF